MQPEQKNINLSQKSLYYGVGSVVVLILEVFALLFGISDGSLIFIVPLLFSPVLGVVGLVFGIIALRRKESNQRAALIGIVTGGLCVLIFAGFIAAIIAITSALQGIS